MVAPRFTNIAILLAILSSFSNAAPVDTGSLESNENSSNSDSKDSDPSSDKSADEHANSDTKDGTATATAEANRSIQTLTAATARTTLENDRSSAVHTEFVGTSLPPTSYYAVPPSYIVETTNSEGMTVTQYKWWMPESASGVSTDKGSTTAATYTEMSTGVSTIAQIYITRSGTKELTKTDYLTSSAGTTRTKQSKSTAASTSQSTSTAAIKSHYSGAANMNVPAVVGANVLVAAAAALLL